MRSSLYASAAIVGIAALGWSADALACGGCFAPPVQGNDPGTVVASHRMVMSVSTEQTILWDQIQYTGSPKTFAWVLPVKPGARVEVGSDAFFDVLDAATSPSIRPPRLTCGVVPSDCSVAEVGARGTSFGCAEDSGPGIDLPDGVPPDPVHVVSRGSAGPYETVILHADEPDALPKWLDKNGFAIPADVAPLIQTYVSEGFDFAALRLLPSSGVQQMRPVRVVMPGAINSLPLRMVAAGTGARTAITLFVISEGRYAPQNFTEAPFPWAQLEWDYQAEQSNYSTLRDRALAPGKEFFVSYAQKGPLFQSVVDPTTGFPSRYETTEGWTYSRISEAYVRQAFINGETSSLDCIDDLAELAADGRRVVLPACDASGKCADVDAATEIDGRSLDCDPPIGSDIPLDDLSQALVGLHPKDVWVTRMEANLARESLATDLVIQPAPSQAPVLDLVKPPLVKNLPATCQVYTAEPAFLPPSGPSFFRRWGDLAAALAVGGFGVLLVLRRRAQLVRVARARGAS
ncbi:MAG: DUF2330 domain-containing protein [Polyangiaceae bacterium]